MDTPNGSRCLTTRHSNRSISLTELALNLWWSWTPEARRLFELIDPTLWVLTNHNPVKLLADVRPDRLMRLAEDPSYMRQYSAALKIFDEYRQNEHSWFRTSTAN